MIVLAFLCAALHYAQANLGGGHHHHHHHHAHDPAGPEYLRQASPTYAERYYETVTSHISHALPGQSSMTIHRTFRVPRVRVRPHQHELHAYHEEAVRTSGQHEHHHEEALRTSGQHQQHQSPFHPQHEQKHSPFNPRFSVARDEVSDEEWQAELHDSFMESGLVRRDLLRQVPHNMVNINFGTHNCVHMGTDLAADNSAYAPTSVSYPTTKDNRNGTYALVMIDADHEDWLHWMIINIPGTHFTEGQIVTQYQGPAPLPDSGPHRYVVLVMKQKDGLLPEQNFASYKSGPCDVTGRAGFDLTRFNQEHGLTDPVAANYFRVEYEPFVDSILEYCSRPPSQLAFSS